MTDFTERHYSIDPGKGKKMAGCPYSTFEDGHDVQDFIIPPKGYVFTGFRFDPNASNQIYDGRLIAEYAKESFKQRIMTNLWKFILIFAIVVIVTLVVILAVSVFRNPKPKHTEKEPEKTVQSIETNKIEDNSTTATFDETPAVTTSTPANPKVESKVDEIVPTINKTPTAQIEETPKPAADDPNTLFRQEFWELIHSRNPSMDAYTDLYNNYRTKVSGEEFDYLRFIILKDYVSFKAWYDKLKTVSESQLQSVETIDALRNKIQ